MTIVTVKEADMVAKLLCFLALLVTGDTNELLKYMHSDGFNINERDEWGGYTLLHYACINNKLQVVKMLVEKGADVNSRGRNNRTPLHEAVLFGCTDTIEYLCNIPQIELHILDDYGNTAFDKASQSSCLLIKLLTGNININELRNYIKQNGFDINMRDEWGGYTLLHYACINNKLQVAELLVENGADVNLCGRNHRTPLHDAVILGHTAIVQFLCSTPEIDLSIQDVKGKTVLDIAQQTDSLIPNKTDIIMLLSKLIPKTFVAESIVLYDESNTDDATVL